LAGTVILQVNPHPIVKYFLVVIHFIIEYVSLLREEQGLIALCSSLLHYEAFASAIGTFCNFLNNLGAYNSIASYHLARTPHPAGATSKPGLFS
jgi:hypothetical protein